MTFANEDDDWVVRSSTRNCSVPSWRVSSSFVKLLRIAVILGAASFCSSSDVDGCNTNLDVLCWHMALRIIGYTSKDAVMVDVDDVEERDVWRNFRLN